jgi:hypothetical protein
MLKNIVLVAAVATTSVLALPAYNSFGVPDNVPANETQLYPPYTYVLPSNYIPQPQ